MSGPTLRMGSPADGPGVWFSIQHVSKKKPVEKGGFSPNGTLRQDAAKLASLDWPPPPSPGHGSGRLTRASASVPTLLLSNASGPTGLPPTKAPVAAPTVRSAEHQARAELWDLRAAVNREKLKAVPPYPFFGRSMRFQDEFSALQITDDGRFSYSTVSFEANDDRPGPINRSGNRRVTTYEGVFQPLQLPEAVVPAAEASSTTAAGAPDEEKGEKTARTDSTHASIEGKASLCHVVYEQSPNQLKLESVTAGTFRFALTVSPFFSPTSATIQPLVPARSPGRPPPRRRQLPYVGPGSSGRGACTLPFGLADVAELSGAVGPEVAQRKRLGPRPKFSAATSSLVPAGEDATMFMSNSLPSLLPDPEKKRTMKPRISGILRPSNSSPNLKTTKTATLAAQDPTKQFTVPDWKDYYKERAKHLLGETSLTS